MIKLVTKTSFQPNGLSVFIDRAESRMPTTFIVLDSNFSDTPINLLHFNLCIAEDFTRYLKQGARICCGSHIRLRLLNIGRTEN